MRKLLLAMFAMAMFMAFGTGAAMAQGNGGGGNGGNGACPPSTPGFPDDPPPGCGHVRGDGSCEDGVDNDGDGRVDFPNDPGCSSASDDSEGGGGNALAFTGTNLVLMFLIGSLVLLAGLRIRALTGGRDQTRAQRAGMA